MQQQTGGEKIVPDVYSDTFQVNISAWGATLNFNLTSYLPPTPGTQSQAERMATVRTSLNHLKVITFILRRQVRQFETESGVTIELPTRVLSALGIAPEDWDTFWR